MNENQTHILFVDDEEHNLFAFNSAFRRHYQVHLGHSAEEGMELLRQYPIEVIITDQRMPEITGVEFLEKIIPDYPDCIRMILTGFSDVEAIIQAINKGRVYRYITKPWDKQELKVTIDNAVEAFRLKKHNRQLVQELKEANQSLEEKVRQRTAELQEKNQNITDSIQYARRMQQAMLPTHEEMQSVLPDSFVFFRPRDMVSGDFYWLAEREAQPVFEKRYTQKGETSVLQGFSNAKIVLAAVDCTGHGVPGAMMSMMANNLLHEIVNEKGISQAATILNHLHEGIVKSLKQNQTDNKDGLDIALCVVDREANTLEFAGAKNPLYFVQNAHLETIPGHRSSVGGIWSGQSARDYSSQLISIQPGDCFYIFSDGYQDQFGGEKKKKFMRKRFRELLFQIYQQPMEEQKAVLEKSLLAWQGALKQVDDILVIGFRV